jgi:formylglycine-generating enzyme
MNSGVLRAPAKSIKQRFFESILSNDRGNHCVLFNRTFSWFYDDTVEGVDGELFDAISEIIEGESHLDWATRNLPNDAKDILDRREAKELLEKLKKAFWTDKGTNKPTKHGEPSFTPTKSYDDEQIKKLKITRDGDDSIKLQWNKNRHLEVKVIPRYFGVSNKKVEESMLWKLLEDGYVIGNTVTGKGKAVAMRDMHERLCGRLTSKRQILAEHLEVDLEVDWFIGIDKKITGGQYIGNTKGTVRGGFWKGRIYLPAPNGAALIDRLWIPIDEDHVRFHEDTYHLRLDLDDGRTGKISFVGRKKLSSGEGRIEFKGAGKLHWRNPWLYIMALFKGRQRITILYNLTAVNRMFWRYVGNTVYHINRVYESNIRRKLLKAIARADRLNIEWLVSTAWGTQSILSGTGSVPRIGRLGPHQPPGETSPLDLAVWLGDASTVDNLIRAGADVTGHQSPFNTALVHAVKSGNGDIVKLLIDAGAAVNNTYDKYSDSSYTKRYVTGFSISNMLREPRVMEGWGDTSALIESVRHIPILHLLLESGADANQQVQDRKTALMAAVEIGCEEAVRTLLESGADAEMQDYKGRTALALARNQPKILAIFEQFGICIVKPTMAQRCDQYVQTINRVYHDQIEMRCLPAVSFQRVDLYSFMARRINLPTFEIGAAPITQGLAEMVAKTEPFSNFASSFTLLPSDAHPWIATWLAAVAFCNALSLIHGFEPCYSDPARDQDIDCDYERNGFRLPMEVEWEFAAFGFNMEDGRLPGREAEWREYGWFPPENGEKVMPVCGKLPNMFGLYDILGNGYEWCNEAWNASPSMRVAKGWKDVEEIMKNPLGLIPLPIGMVRLNAMPTFRVVRRP